MYLKTNLLKSLSANGQKNPDYNIRFNGRPQSIHCPGRKIEGASPFPHNRHFRILPARQWRKPGSISIQCGPMSTLTITNSSAGLCSRKPDAEILINEILLSHLKESYRDLLKAAQGSDLLITHPITFAGPLVAEKTRIPWISTVLAPISFFSAYDLPVFPPYPYLKKLDFLGAVDGQAALEVCSFYDTALE